MSASNSMLFEARRRELGPEQLNGDGRVSGYSVGDPVWYSSKEIGWWPCMVLQVDGENRFQLRAFGDNHEFGWVEEEKNSVLPFTCSKCKNLIKDQLKKLKRKCKRETLKYFVSGVREALEQCPSFKLDSEVFENLDQLSLTITTPPPCHTLFPALDDSDIFTPSSYSRPVENGATGSIGTGTRRSQRRRTPQNYSEQCSGTTERPQTDFLVRRRSRESGLRRRKRKHRSESPQGTGSSGCTIPRDNGRNTPLFEESAETLGSGRDPELPLPIRRRLDMDEGSTTEEDAISDILTMCDGGNIERDEGGVGRREVSGGGGVERGRGEGGRVWSKGGGGGGGEGRIEKEGGDGIKNFRTADLASNQRLIGKICDGGESEEEILGNETETMKISESGRHTKTPVDTDGTNDHSSNRYNRHHIDTDGDTVDSANQSHELNDVRVWTGVRENSHRVDDTKNLDCDVPNSAQECDCVTTVVRVRRDEDKEMKKLVADRNELVAEERREKGGLGEKIEEEEKEEEEDDESESSEDDDLPIIEMNKPTNIKVSDLREGDHIWYKYHTFPHWPALVVEVFPAKKPKRARAKIVYFGDNADYAPVSIKQIHSKNLARYVCGNQQYDEFMKAGRECGKHSEYFLRSVKEAESFIGDRCSKELTGTPLEMFRQMCEKRPTTMAPPPSWSSHRLSAHKTEERPVMSAFGFPLNHDLMSMEDREEQEEEEEDEEEEDGKEEEENTLYTLDKVLQCFTSLKPVLIEISRGTVPSEYHRLYNSGLAKERQKLKVCKKLGPCSKWNADKQLAMVQHLQKMMIETQYSHDASNQSSFFTYAGDVLLPEAMIRTISKFEGISEPEAKSRL